MPFEIEEERGFLRMARNAGDMMSWFGLAELYLCLGEQYPEMSRQNPDMEMLYKKLKVVQGQLNKWEFAHVLTCYMQNVLELGNEQHF